MLVSDYCNHFIYLCIYLYIDVFMHVLSASTKLAILIYNFCTIIAFRLHIFLCVVVGTHHTYCSEVCTQSKYKIVTHVYPEAFTKDVVKIHTGYHV